MKIIKERIGGINYVLRMGVKFRSGRAIYLHKWDGGDKARWPHDHPKDFISIGLWGSYVEETYRVRPNEWNQPRLRLCDIKTWQAPWFRRFPAEHIHKVIEPRRCWTLVITSPYRRKWGFWTDDAEFVSHDEY